MAYVVLSDDAVHLNDSDACAYSASARLQDIIVYACNSNMQLNTCGRKSS